MMNFTRFTAMMAVFTLMAAPAVADWMPGDGHKMHFPQLPDPNGWDVNITADTMFDDWRCSQTGPVSDIHFWGSWQSDLASPFLWINVEIWSDMPANDPLNELGYSYPDVPLWSRMFQPSQFTERLDGMGDQGWFDPQPADNQTVIPGDHQQYWQINFQNIQDPFIQQKDEIYWLGIHAAPSDISTAFGWKTSQDHWNDDGVYWWTFLVDPPPNVHWRELINPLPPNESLDLAFVITIPEPASMVLLLFGAVGIAASTLRRN